MPRLIRYISSPNFSQSDKFKSRRSLLQSTEKSLNTSCLRPVNGTVCLHNDSLVTVPIFDAKHMIISLLTDPSLMKQSNFTECYNILVGEVLNDHPEKKNTVKYTLEMLGVLLGIDIVKMQWIYQ